jgi:glucoamylase
VRVNRGEYPKLLPTGLAAALLCGMALVAASPAAAGPGDAPGGPGSLSHHDLARKDCLGTARNTASKIWYTVANGVLSDVYAPTVEATNVETMQYLVTDGSSFTDLQARDMTYTVNADTTGMACTVTATAKSGNPPTAARAGFATTATATGTATCRPA